jgi:hypothetical protein
MYKRSPNAFEKILLIIGIALVMVGYTFIHRMWVLSGSVLTWELISNMLLWLLAVILIIQLAVSENVKEELALLYKNQLEETKLMRQEIKLLGKKKKR